MNIYFTASRSLLPEFGENYNSIISTIEKLGHKVIHQHITKDPHTTKHADSQEEYKEFLKQLTNAALVVAELSFPSTLNVGHRVAVALEKGKPVIGLHLQGKQSNFFLGLKSDKFVYEEYSPSTLEDVLKQALEYAQDTSDTRFNFLISPPLLEYLDWISQHNRIPRSVYLRRLIESDRTKNRGYSPN